jgi:signal transduction histidine kinase
MVSGDPESLREVTLNLLLNGMEAAGTGSGSEALVVLQVEASEDGAEIRVGDSGPGPDAETSQRMFDPFVSEKPEGTGLGLYLSQQIVEAHGGSIRWQREDGLTEFVVWLPDTAQPQSETS